MNNKEIKPFWVDATDLTKDKIKWLWEVCVEKGSERETLEDWLEGLPKFEYLGLDGDLETHSRSSLWIPPHLTLTLEQVPEWLGVEPYKEPKDTSNSFLDALSEEGELCLKNPTGYYVHTPQNLVWKTFYSESDIVSKVNHALKVQLGIDTGINPISPDNRIKEDLSTDSLNHVQLITYLEEEFDIEISDELAESVQTVQDIYDKVKELLGRRYNTPVQHPETYVDEPEGIETYKQFKGGEDATKALSDAFKLISEFSEKNEINLDFQPDITVLYPFGDDGYQVNSGEDVLEIVNALAVLDKYKEK